MDDNDIPHHDLDKGYKMLLFSTHPASSDRRLGLGRLTISHTHKAERGVHRSYTSTSIIMLVRSRMAV
jgi:hypothetical protein